MLPVGLYNDDSIDGSRHFDTEHDHCFFLHFFSILKYHGCHHMDISNFRHMIDR
jgi:hypothetical protein